MIDRYGKRKGETSLNSLCNSLNWKRDRPILTAAKKSPMFCLSRSFKWTPCFLAFIFECQSWIKHLCRSGRADCQCAKEERRHLAINAKNNVSLQSLTCWTRKLESAARTQRDTMVVLREGMCPGLGEDLVRDLRAADVRTGELCRLVLKRLNWQ